VETALAHIRIGAECAGPIARSLLIHFSTDMTSDGRNAPRGTVSRLIVL
jgi:hypothetical protein